MEEKSIRVAPAVAISAGADSTQLVQKWTKSQSWGELNEAM